MLSILLNLRVSLMFFEGFLEPGMPEKGMGEMRSDQKAMSGSGGFSAVFAVTRLQRAKDDSEANAMWAIPGTRHGCEQADPVCLCVVWFEGPPRPPGSSQKPEGRSHRSALRLSIVRRSTGRTV